jgi:predicted metal-dependent HD superfamily phosphohydrolase
MGDVDQPDIITAAEDYVRQIFEQKIPSDVYTYHNWTHTCQVRDEVLLLARQEGVTNGDLVLLNLATLFHDVGFSETYSGHEEVGIRLIKEFLAKWNYPEEKVRTIVGLIEATKMDTKPRNKLEALIKDADTSSLGKSYFQIYTNSLRKELNVLQHALISKKDWNRENLRFIDEHEYYSEAGKGRYSGMKAENRKLLEEEIAVADKNDGKAKKKEATTKKIAGSRSAQTLFRTALRNHINLSSMADNKANIMLSVNALIITFALPLLGKEVAVNKALLIPMVLLLTVCVTSMVFATLATRPIPMKGYSSMESIMAKKSNLFFFGNFYKMEFDEYEKGMLATISNADILDSTIMRDLFFLGKTIGNKFVYLRKCYTIFMYGIIITVISFVIVYAVHH